MPCMLCGCDSVELVFEVHGHELVRCAGCGLVSTAEQPSDEERLRLYGREYFTGESEHGVDYVADPNHTEYDRARFDDSLDLLERHAPKRGRLLDVGCATGNFLVSAQKRGWDVLGAELSADAASIAAEQHGLDVWVGSPSQAGWRGIFDAVTMNHVLEHIPSPDTYLREEIAPVLAPGGMLMIEVPNFESIHSRVNGARWADVRPEQHLFHFTADSLSRLLASSGFEVTELATLPEPQTSILGPLVYLHVPEPSRRAMPATDAHVDHRDARADGEGARRVLRRCARSWSMPLSRHYARKLMELRLVAVARLAKET